MLARRFPAHKARGAGGIEPRTPDLQVLWRQALTCIGEDGLASCLVLLCSDQGLAKVVEAWPQLSAPCKRIVLEALSDGGGGEGRQ